MPSACGEWQIQLIKKAVALEGISRLEILLYFHRPACDLQRTLVLRIRISTALRDSLHRNKGELVGNYVKLAKKGQQRDIPSGIIKKQI